MARIPLWQSDPARVDRALDVLRGGGTRAAAARAANVGLETLLRWVDESYEIRTKIEAAENNAREKGVRPAAIEPAKGKPKKEGERWSIVREEAAKLGPGIFGILLWVDGLLQTKGFPALSAWWIWILGAFYAAGLRWLILLVGRRGGKSSTLCRVAVVEALFGEHAVSPGDPLVWPIFSTDMAEARGRLRMISAVLSVLGIEHAEGSLQGRPRIITKTIADHDLEFRVYPATVAGASGFTAPGITCDEEAKWKDEESGANPAREVLRAVRPTMATQPRAHGYRCSSAFAESGTHHEAVTSGNTALQFVARLGPFVEEARRGFYLVADLEQDEDAAKAIRAHAEALTEDSPAIPSWIANPTLDPALTRLDEPDLLTWLREYGSVSSSAGEAIFFDAIHLARAASLTFRGEGETFCAIDPGTRRNAFALAIVRRIWTGAAFSFAPLALRQWIPAPGAPLDLRLVVLPEAAKLARSFGCDTWITDAHALTDVEIVGAEHGIATIVRAEGEAFEREGRPVRDGLHRGQVALAGCEGVEELIAQLRGVRSKLTGGRQVMTWPESGDLHGDLARAWVSACAAAGAGQEVNEPEPIATIPGPYQHVDPRARRVA